MIFILTGGKDAGKTSFARDVAWVLQKKGYIIRGFLSVGNPETGHRKRFVLFDLTGRKSLPLAEPEMKKDYIPCGRYFFNPVAVQKGEAIIRTALPDKTDLVVMDEIGKCELNGMIWDASFRLALASSCNLMIVIAGKNLDRLIAHYKIEDYRLFNLLYTSVEQVAACIQNYTG